MVKVKYMTGDELNQQQDIQERINKLRREQSITTRMLSEDTGLRLSVVGKILTGYETATKPALERIAAALGTTVNWLETGVNNIWISVDERLPEYGNKVIAIVAFYDQGSHDVITVILRPDNTWWTNDTRFEMVVQFEVFYWMEIPNVPSDVELMN